MLFESLPSKESFMAADGAGTPNSPISPLWQEAIRNYYNELAKGGIRASAIDKDLWQTASPEELIAHVETEGGALAARSVSWSKALAQVKPVLLGLNDFVALSSWLMGVNAKVAVVLWGSVKLIIKAAQPVLPDIIEMLKSLENALPRMQRYEKELPMTESLEHALSKLYGEIIIFCAHALAFLRNNPEVNKKQLRWTKFSSDITAVIKNIRQYSQKVDEAASMVRLAKETHNTETLAALKAIGDLQISGGATLPCHMVPYGLNLRFFGRSSELDLLKNTLDPSNNTASLRAIGIHGLGGVGKSQLALQYANTSTDNYKVIAWIPAETQIKLVQGLSSLALKLGIAAEETSDDYQNVSKVRDWLNRYKQPFLLIFDNVENTELLQQIWPTSTQGSIIITTRSPSQASKRATSTLALQPFPRDPGADFLRTLVGQQPVGEEDELALKEICSLIGGLPLATMQISDFIRDRGYSYSEFLALYKKSAERIFAKLGTPVEYNSTVLTTWDISLEKLSPEATLLQQLLVFFDPDIIPERLITNTKASIEDPRFEFLFDEFDYGDAVMELNRTSMVSRLSSHKALSLHRIVQLAVFSRLSASEKVELFDIVVKILYFDFPNTWKDRGAQHGHGWASWETCSAILPHVSWLMRLCEKHKIRSADPALWAELVFRAGTYLWEKEQPTTAKDFFEYGLKVEINEPGSALVVAQAHRLLGNIYLDLPKPQAALATYQKNMKLREAIDGPDTPPVADACNSIACSYTEAGDTEQAFTWLDKATAIHDANDPSQKARTLAIRSMTCLRAGQTEDALLALSECWKLQGMTQSEIEASKYPKHSGDIMLLSRAYWLQGKKQEAQELASRTITMRRGVFGENGGPRVADSLFTVARMLEDSGELSLAAKLLRQVITMSGDSHEMRGHLARACWFCANIEAKLGADESIINELRQKAQAARQLIDGKEWPDEDTDENFMRLVGWMLW